MTSLVGGYVIDCPKESYKDIKRQYFTKLNISVQENVDDEYLFSMETIEKPRTISKPMRIPKDKNSLGDDILKHMLKANRNEIACSPPSSFETVKLK